LSVFSRAGQQRFELGEVGEVHVLEEKGSGTFLLTVRAVDGTARPGSNER